jgi:cytochrome P450
MDALVQEQQRLNWYQQMRASTPVAYDEQRNLWQVFRYAEVQRVLTDFATFSSDMLFPESVQSALTQSLVGRDPPLHRVLRTLVSLAFTPRRVAELAPRIQQIVDQLLEQVSGEDQMDVIADLAYPLPATVIAELLGIPTEDKPRFRLWSEAIVGGSYEEETVSVPMGASGPSQQAQKEMAPYFLSLLEARRHQPQDDLLSALVTAQVEGERLKEDDLLSFCILLLVAGYETTTNLIGNAILCFDEYPTVIERIHTTPDLLPDAIEEVLRYRSPVHVLVRRVTAPTRLGDQELQAGQRVAVHISSANRDEAQFPHAERFDIERSPNRHLAFGHGIHFCLGAPLARLEAKIVLSTLLQQFPHMQRSREVPLTLINSPIVL